MNTENDTAHLARAVSKRVNSSKAELTMRRSSNSPHVLGVVYAPDEKSAEAAAIAEYKISEDMRRRLIVRPNDD
jgi:hypothetical protein